MKILVCSDVHGNMSALDAVLEYHESAGPCRMLFLGDAVGYGAHPDECLDRLLAVRNATMILGNHDNVVLDLAGEKTFHEGAATAIEWTVGILAGRYDKAIRERFRLIVEEDMFTASHGSPFLPGEFTYVLSYITSEEAFRECDFSLCFTGHTHVPMVYTYSSGPKSLDEGKPFALDPSDRYIINPGSVGQPRDGDNRASFIIFDPEAGSVVLRRLEYDIESEARDIRKAGLPEWFADRLHKGR